MDTPCIRCDEKGTSCCRNRQIVLTRGDIERISAFTGRGDFLVFEFPSPEYLDQDDDPVWNRQTIRQDGTRRVLRRTAAGKCTMLTDSGCSLPLTVRPLICRLHPYTYTERALLDLDADCPIAVMSESENVLAELGMAGDDVDCWHRMLYSELREETSPQQ